MSHPAFIDAANKHFHLSANSPAIDAGVEVGLFYEGNGPDMGAFEYEAGTVSLGILEITAASKIFLTIFPNPAHFKAALLFHTPLILSNTRLRIINLAGEIIEDRMINDRTGRIDLNFNDLEIFSSSVFFVQLINGSTTIQKKLLVIR